MRDSTQGEVPTRFHYEENIISNPLTHFGTWTPEGWRVHKIRRGETALERKLFSGDRETKEFSGLPVDFVEDLRADRDALDACNTGKHSDNLEGVESTSAIDTLLSQAQAIVTRLDAAIQNKYSRDPDKLAAWKSASRTERSAKKAAAPATPPLAA